MLLKEKKLTKHFKSIVLFLLFSISFYSYGKQKTLEELAWEKAVKRVEYEFETQLSNKIGNKVNAKDYLMALYHFSHGEIQKGKSLSKQIIMKEVFTVILGNNFASVIGSAWEFDKWIWNSTHQWADDRNKNIFINEFLKKRMKKWYEENRFGEKNRFDRNFTTELTKQFNLWCEERFFGIGASNLYIKKNQKFKQFKKDMWNILLLEVREVSIRTKLREASVRAINKLKKKIKKYQIEYIKKYKSSHRLKKNQKIETPQKRSVHVKKRSQTDTEAKILSEFRSLYPVWLKSNASPDVTVIVTANAVKIGHNKYRVANESWLVVSSGVNKGKRYKGGTANWIMSLSELKNATRLYKKKLGIK